MKTEEKLRLSLLFLRLGVFTVMFMWTLDKFINPDHAIGIFKQFYFLNGLSTGIMYALGAVEMVVVLGFVAGFKKRWTYGIVLVLHVVSTFSSFGRYLDPWKNLLFFAAWPMLAACVTLYLLRDDDTLCAVETKSKPGGVK
jgi:putative oxidoreductase